MNHLLKVTLICSTIIFTGIFFIGCGAGNSGGSSGASNADAEQSQPETSAAEPRVVAATANSDNNIVVIFNAPANAAAFNKESYRITATDGSELPVLAVKIKNRGGTVAELTTALQQHSGYEMVFVSRDSEIHGTDHTASSAQVYFAGFRSHRKKPVFSVNAVSPLLHILPPLASDFGDINNFDRSLLEFITISVCEVIDDESCVPYFELTSGSGQHHSIDVRLANEHYIVNWKPLSGDGNKTFEIHYLVAGLDLGSISYFMQTPRTLPIKFRIDNHPLTRARVLAEQGLSAAEVALVLKNEFGLDEGEIIDVLATEQYGVVEIGEALRDVYGADGKITARLLAARDYSAIEITQVLRIVFGFDNDPEGVALILKDEAGFDASSISDALALEINLDPAAILKILRAIGFDPSELFGAESLLLAKQFAPQLRFDQAASTFPMSAQDYFDNVIENDNWLKIRVTSSDYPGFNSPDLHIYQNTDTGTLSGTNQTPTYFKAFQLGNQVRIVYWWYYGWQPGCIAPVGIRGVHYGDWEHVMVVLSEDRSKVAAVTYWQHSGHYTRLAEGADKYVDLGTSYEPGLELDGDHPVVYVGKGQHGSYHNQGGIGVGGLSGCLYFDDWRNNNDRTDLRMDSQNNLVSLAEMGEEWMREESSVNNYSVGTGDGNTTEFELDSRYVKGSSLMVIVDGILVAEPGDHSIAWLLDCSGIGCKDKIAFLAAPADGAVITASYERGDFVWGWDGCNTPVFGSTPRTCPEFDIDWTLIKPLKNTNVAAIGTHPVTSGDSNAAAVGSLLTCKGLDATTLGKTRGCFESQCEYHDNQDLYTLELTPGTCKHCPSGYTDMGLYCGKGFWPWEWSTRAIHWYGLDYTISTTDRGLLRSK